LDLALKLVFVFALLRLRLLGTADLELLFGQLAVGHRVLERRRGALLVLIIDLGTEVVVLLVRAGPEVVLDRTRLEAYGFQSGGVLATTELGGTVVVLVLSSAVVGALRRG